MDISRKTDYALRMLAMLAEEPERLLSVRTAAEEVNVPYSFARSPTTCFDRLPAMGAFRFWAHRMGFEPARVRS